jgi:hypothetical protein
MIFEVFMSVKSWIVVFRIMALRIVLKVFTKLRNNLLHPLSENLEEGGITTLCSLVGNYQRFGGTFRLHLQGTGNKTEAEMEYLSNTITVALMCSVFNVYDKGNVEP